MSLPSAEGASEDLFMFEQHRHQLDSPIRGLTATLRARLEPNKPGALDSNPEAIVYLAELEEIASTRLLSVPDVITEGYWGSKRPQIEQWLRTVFVEDPEHSQPQTYSYPLPSIANSSDLLLKYYKLFGAGEYLAGIRLFLASADQSGTEFLKSDHDELEWFLVDIAVKFVLDNGLKAGLAVKDLHDAFSAPEESSQSGDEDASQDSEIHDGSVATHLPHRGDLPRISLDLSSDERQLRGIGASLSPQTSGVLQSPLRGEYTATRAEDGGSLDSTANFLDASLTTIDTGLGTSCEGSFSSTLSRSKPVPEVCVDNGDEDEDSSGTDQVYDAEPSYPRSPLGLSPRPSPPSSLVSSLTESASYAERLSDQDAASRLMPDSQDARSTAGSLNFPHLLEGDLNAPEACSEDVQEEHLTEEQHESQVRYQLSFEDQNPQRTRHDVVTRANSAPATLPVPCTDESHVDNSKIFHSSNSWPLLPYLKSCRMRITCLESHSGTKRRTQEVLLEQYHQGKFCGDQSPVAAVAHLTQPPEDAPLPEPHAASASQNISRSSQQSDEASSSGDEKRTGALPFSGNDSSSTDNDAGHGPSSPTTHVLEATKGKPQALPSSAQAEALPAAEDQQPMKKKKKKKKKSNPSQEHKGSQETPELSAQNSEVADTQQAGHSPSMAAARFHGKYECSGYSSFDNISSPEVARASVCPVNNTTARKRFRKRRRK